MEESLSQQLTEKLEALKTLDDEIHEEMTLCLPRMVEFQQTARLPNTLRASLMLITKCNFLKTAIFDGCETTNVYSTSILFRSLTEHCLKMLYILMRWAEEQDDTVGSEYYFLCKYSEDMDYINALSFVNKTADANYVRENPFECLTKVRPEVSEYTPQQIQDAALKFKYRSILTYIESRINRVRPGISPYFADIIPKYAELSSFVHGGPFADECMLRYAKEDQLESELAGLAKISLVVDANVKLTALLIFLNLSDEFKRPYLRINDLIKNNSDIL